MSDRKRSLSAALYAVTTLIALYLGYSLNLWRATDYRQYTDGPYAFMQHEEMLGPQGGDEGLLTFDRFSESLVLGRLVASRDHGLFSWGGFTGWFTGDPGYPYAADPIQFRTAYQYKLYLDESLTGQPQTYDVYQSQLGGQAFFLGVLDGVLPFGSTTKLKFYYHLMAALTAGVFVLILLWFYREFGTIAGWLLTAFLCLSCYPTLYAKSIFWILWAFYVPFLCMLRFYEREERANGAFSLRSLLVLMFAAMSLKLFLTGCDYVTVALVMAWVPQCYYAIKNRWTRKRFVHCALVSLTACVLALCVFFVALSFQHVLAGETFLDGVNRIGDRFLARTHGDTLRLTEELGAREPATAPALLRWFFTVPVVFDFRGMGVGLVMGMKSLMAPLVLLTLGWAALFCRGPRDALPRAKRVALVATLWISALAPCSWFVVFKSHSDVHRSIVGIVWYMPFLLYGAAIVGVTLDAVVTRFRIGRRLFPA
ncbi:MAG: hypothetical protein ACYTAS_18555 [Planctomycetota bacterium]|jgi:hypothetical protein